MDGMDACIAGSATEARPRQMRPREVRNVKFKITPGYICVVLQMVMHPHCSTVVTFRLPK